MANSLRRRRLPQAPAGGAEFALIRGDSRSNLLPPMAKTGASALDRFRAETGKPGGEWARGRAVRPPVPLRQRWLIASLLLWFAVTLFWFRAGLDPLGHYVSLGLGLFSVLWLFIPLGGGVDLPDGTPRAHFRRLLAQPVFWLGLVTLGYCLVQVLNYGWELKVIPGKGGRMVEVPRVEWLPAGVRVPSDFTNSPRAGILQLALPWLLACTVLVGLRSRRALDWLLHGALAILFLWTVMALGYYYTGGTSIYWGIEMGKNNTPWFWGTVKNPNHGAILQVFGLLACLGLAGRGFRRSLSLGRLGGVQLFYLALALFFSLATLQSLARAGILFVALIWVAAVVGGGVLAYRQRSMALVSLFAGFFVVLMSIAVVVVVINMRDQGWRNPFVRTITQTVAQLESAREGELVDRRAILNRVTQRLVASSPVYGYGVGSWSVFYRRFSDPLEDWELWVAYTPWARGADGQRLLDENGNPYRTIVPMHFDHAHNEYLQYLGELGVVGVVPLALLVLALPFALLRRLRSIGYLGLAALGATAVVLLHSLIEFPTRTPALGLLFALLLAIGVLELRLRREG
jgi:O-antigen ligase